MKKQDERFGITLAALFWIAFGYGMWRYVVTHPNQKTAPIPEEEAPKSGDMPFMPGAM